MGMCVLSFFKSAQKDKLQKPVSASRQALGRGQRQSTVGRTSLLFMYLKIKSLVQYLKTVTCSYPGGRSLDTGTV